MLPRVTSQMEGWDLHRKLSQGWLSGEHGLTALHPIASLNEEYSICLNNTDGLGMKVRVLTTLQMGG